MEAGAEMENAEEVRIPRDLPMCRRGENDESREEQKAHPNTRESTTKSADSGTYYLAMLWKPHRLSLMTRSQLPSCSSKVSPSAAKDEEEEEEEIDEENLVAAMIMVR